MAAEPLGHETVGVLLALFQESQRQLTASEEDIHRTLPFFATALGLTVAAFTVVAGQMPALSTVASACVSYPAQPNIWPILRCSWPVMLAGTLLVVAAILATGVLWALGGATAQLEYRRIGPEATLLQRAKDLGALQRGQGIAGDAGDAAVALKLRRQLVEDLAELLPNNRRLTVRRYRYRARALTWLLWSLFCVLAATIIAVGSSKLGLLPKASP